jgi:vacuolar-type H+-ATPase subunit H
MTIERLLNEMENMFLDGARVPFTNKRVLEEDDFARLLDEIREHLPQEIQEAKRIISDRQRILDDAQKEAQTVVEQAKTYISKMTDENIVTKQAQERAGEILGQAQKDAVALQHDALNYANDVFSHLEEQLENALDVVKKGHADLHHTKKE